METARKKKGGEEKKNSGCTVSFYVEFFEDSIWTKKNCLMEGIYFGCKVIVQKSNYRYIFFTQQLTEIW